MSDQQRIIPLVMESLDRLIDAQAHAHIFERNAIAQDIARVRWELGELLCKLQTLLFRAQVITVYRDGSPMPHVCNTEREADIVIEYAKTHGLQYVTFPVDTPDQYVR